MKTIKTNTVDGVTMVWYLNEDKAAVVKEIEKNDWTGKWEIKVKGGGGIICDTKASAVAHAKKMLKATM
jgi:hypothetical protein